MIKFKILSLIIILISFYSCLKEMPEKGLQISVPQNNPIENLQTLLRDDEKTKILLLGVPTLRVLNKTYTPAVLNKLVDNLYKFKPDVICLDALAPQEISNNINDIDYLKLYQLTSKDITLISRLRKKFKLDDDRIENKIDSLISLINYGGKINLNIRKQLIELFILDYDFLNAALQFQYVIREDIPKLKLDKDFIKKLEYILNNFDENTFIGIKLANKLNINKLYSINNISDKKQLNSISEKLYREMKLSDVYNFHKSDIINQVADTKLKEGLKNQDLLDFFLYLNSDSYILQNVESNWSIYLKMFLESGLDRRRIALWEMKNLRIASNIREITSLYPSKKILVLIDIAKKPFVEEYLKKMSDIKILKLQEIIYFADISDKLYN